ncbi:class I SAM-dependent methyltransferase [Chloroflexi bacterium TSY]|nr:class I SAM-dependent methyltransferase [Chloroflexi bacterium TSY]
MSEIKEIVDPHDPQYVTSQYQDASNLNARIRLHRRFSTNKYGWPRWVFDQFGLPPQCRILELGCGTGDLWFENLDRLSAGWEIVLSDFSSGMLRHARHNLGDNRNFRFGVIDAQSIPFESGSFDAVVANHMLYHVPNRARALAEIQRVLKSDGRFYAATIGTQDLQEMAALVGKFDSQLASWRRRLSDSFTLENGSAQLTQWFDGVTLHHYEDSLIITEAAPLVDYILSGRINLSADRQRDFARFVQQELQLCGGKLYVTKASGIFESSGPLQA